MRKKLFSKTAYKMTSLRKEQDFSRQHCRNHLLTETNSQTKEKNSFTGLVKVLRLD